MILRKPLRYALRFILALLAFLVVYVLAARLLPYIPVNKDAQQVGQEDMSIYIMTNGVHTDIVVPVKNSRMDWTRYVSYAHTDDKDSSLPFVGIGWGDKGFYLETPEWKDLKVSVAIKAMFHLGTAALHVTFYKQIRSGEDCKEIRISFEEYDRLVQFIADSFQKDANGNSIHIPSENDGYGTTDAFYEANGSYDIFNTCNTWANNALKACGQRACFWTATDRGIFYHYRHQ